MRVGHSMKPSALLVCSCSLLTCMAVSRLIQAATQRLVGLFVGLFQALVLKFYQYVVDPAPGDSWPARFFAYLATGPFRSVESLPQLIFVSVYVWATGYHDKVYSKGQRLPFLLQAMDHPRCSSSCLGSRAVSSLLSA